MIRGCLYAAFALLVWGVTFASTRTLLLDFSVLKILVVRFMLAWVALWGMERARHGSHGARACDVSGVGNVMLLMTNYTV